MPLGASQAIFPRWELSQVPFGDHAGCPLGDEHDRGWQFLLQSMLLPFWEMLRALLRERTLPDVEAILYRYCGAFLRRHIAQRANPGEEQAQTPNFKAARLEAHGFR